MDSAWPSFLLNSIEDFSAFLMDRLPFASHGENLLEYSGPVSTLRVARYGDIYFLSNMYTVERAEAAYSPPTN